MLHIKRNIFNLNGVISDPLYLHNNKGDRMINFQNMKCVKHASWTCIHNYSSITKFFCVNMAKLISGTVLSNMQYFRYISYVQLHTFGWNMAKTDRFSPRARQFIYMLNIQRGTELSAAFPTYHKRVVFELHIRRKPIMLQCWTLTACCSYMMWSWSVTVA